MVRLPRALIVLLALTLFSQACTAALRTQEASQGRLDAPGEERFVRDLVEAANDGDRSTLREILRVHMAPAVIEGGRLESIIDALLFDVRRYGPMHYTSSVMDDGQEMHWLRAYVTRTWLGMKVHEGDAGYGGFAIRRGSAPVDAAVEVPSDLPAALAAYLRELADTDRFSGSVLVADGGEIVFAAGHGRLSPDGPEITPDTPLNIASVGKMFTAVAALQLVERGDLALDGPVGEWVPEFPRAIGDAVTVRDLLLHTSGIELDEIPAFNERMMRAESVSEILEAQVAFADSLLEPDGSYVQEGTFDYTNEGINLLGVIIERASGEPYCAYLTRHVFEPAGMENTHCAFGEHEILGYAYNPADPLGPRITNEDDLGAIPWPAGMHLSSARDLYRFHRALMSGGLLSDDLVREATRVQIVEAETSTITYAYGYGFEIQDYLGLTSVGHSGGMEGVSARFSYYPAADRLVVVLSNYDTAGVIVASYLRDLTAAR